MNLVVLRGRVDRPNEIAFRSINEEEDMWTVLFHRVLHIDPANNMGYMVYWGNQRQQYMDVNFWVLWVPDLAQYKPDIKPDVIFARGGFPEYVPFLKKHPKAFKIYYGAGKRYIPRDGIRYDLIMADCEDQILAIQKAHPGVPVELFFKPAVESLFYLQTEDRKYDCCFVALKPEDERKRVKWVYRNAPKDLRILQLGNRPEFPVPENVKVRKVMKREMPYMMRRCKVGILPYTSDDSGPRVLTEFLACGIPVVALPDLQYWWGRFGQSVIVEQGKEFWQAVREAAGFSHEMRMVIRQYYQDHLSIQKAAEHLYGVIRKHYEKNQ